MKIIVIIQARLSSKRLPEKILKKIYKNYNSLEIIFKRLSKLKSCSRIIFAIPKNENKLSKYLNKKKLPFYSGSPTNVLDRYYKCALKERADIIVRITADCPLIDPKIVDDAISLFIKKKDIDLLSNYSPPTFPDGQDVAVFSFSALKYAWSNAISKFDKEHVVNYLIQSKKINRFNFENKIDLSNMRITLDEKEDLKVIKNIFNYYGKINFSWKKIAKLFNNKPSIFKANQKILRDEGSNINSGQKLWKESMRFIPGGTMLLSKSPDFYLPNKWPTYYSKAKGCKIWDLDGNEFIDMSMMGIGTNILGYGNKKIDEAVKKKLSLGNMSTLNSPEEVELAKKLIKLHPWSDMCRFTRSGGEANAVAIRIARSFSKKQKIAVCGYHGWHDWYLAANLLDKNRLNNHLITGLKPTGVPKNLKNTTFTFQYNNFRALLKLLQKEKEIGIIKMEVSRNFSPKNNFLKKIRKICDQKNIILIFDECTSGFRQTFGGLHKLYGVNPDLAIFGKALGNGYAINAIIGKKKFMEASKNSFISSTFWTEGIGPVAALNTLKEMERLKSWEVITKKGNFLRNKWMELGKKYNLNLEILGYPAISSFIIKSKNFLNYRTFITQEMLKKSILATNVVYLSTEHKKKYLVKYLRELEKIFKVIAECEKGKEIKSLLEVKKISTSFGRLN